MRLPAVIVLLFILQAAAANPGGTPLDVASITSLDARIEAPSVVLESAETSEGRAAAFGGFRVDATRLYVEIDHAQYNATLFGAAATEPDTYTQRMGLRNVSLQSASPGPRAYVFLLGEGEADLSGAVHVSTGDAPAQDPWIVNDRDPLRGHEEDGRVTLPGPATIHVQAPFTLAVWDWSLDYEAEEGSGSLQTGEQQSSVAGPVEKRHLRQAYLHVQEGSATFSVTEPTGFSAYVQDARLRGHQVSLHSATGNLAGRSLQSSEVRLVDADLGVTGGEDHLGVVVAKGSAYVDGALVTKAAPGPSWIVPVVLAVVLLGAAWPVRAGIQKHRWQSLERHLDAGEFESVVRLSRRFRWGKHAFDAAVARAVACIRGGAPDAAYGVVADMRPRTRQEHALKEYLFAYLCELHGDAEGMKEHMARSLKLDSSFRIEFFASVVKGLRPRDALEGYS